MIENVRPRTQERAFRENVNILQSNLEKYGVTGWREFIWIQINTNGAQNLRDTLKICVTISFSREDFNSADIHIRKA